MKLTPRLPDESVNVSKRGRSRAVLELLLGALLVVSLFFFALGLAVDALVDHLDPQTEVTLFEGEVAGMLDAVQAGGFDAEASRALMPIFERVREAAPELPYLFDVRVSCDEAPNAFALPGGGVVVTSGLLEIIDTEEELSFILGHELGHFVHRDHLRQMGRMLALQLVMGGMLFSTGIDPTIGLQLVVEAMSNAHSRGQEIAADIVGLSVLARLSPHDVSGAARALNALHDATEARMYDRIDFTRSHPLGPKRLSALSQQVSEQGFLLADRPGTPLPPALKAACQAQGDVLSGEPSVDSVL